MNNRWFKILLVISFALNLAFVGHFIYKRFDKQKQSESRRPPKPRPEVIVDTDFQLKPEQKTEIKKVIKKFELMLMEYKQKILDQRIALIEAMGSDMDPSDIESKTNQLNKLENDLNLLFINTLVQVNTLLEPEQRLNFLYKLSKYWFFIRTRPTETKRPDR